MDYSGKLEVIFIATKTSWPWLSYLTWSFVEKALEKSCKWLLFCSLVLYLGLVHEWGWISVCRKHWFKGYCPKPQGETNNALHTDFCVFSCSALGQCACSPAQTSVLVGNSAPCWKAAYMDSYRCFVANHYDVGGTIWNNRLLSGNWQFLADLSWPLPPP